MISLHPFLKIFKDIKKFPLLRNIFLILTLIALAYPLYSFFYIYPIFNNVLISYTEDEAVRSAKFLNNYLFIETKQIDEKIVTTTFRQKIQNIQKSLQLEKIKVFSPSGKIIFSTNASDIGKVNKYPYFKEVIEKGTIHQNVVRSGTMSLENQVIPVTVFEVYVPIAVNNSIIGAFEIYYDITSKEKLLNEAIAKATAGVIVIGTILLFSTIFVLFQASKAITKKQIAETALKVAFDQMETKVEERTLALQKSNKELEAEINIRKQTETELRFAKTKAESADKIKSQFLENVSHELRTPLHHIIGYGSLGLSKSNGLSDKSNTEYYTYINDSAHELKKLVEALLDLSTLESGSINITFNKVDMNLLIAQEINNLKYPANEKDIIVLLAENKQSTEIMCDINRIQQVARSILTNAIHYSPSKKTIKISISLVTDIETINEGGKSPTPQMYVAIKDQGIGIPEDELELIFNKFTLSSLTNTGAGGKGLGLAICKKIIEIHEGSIWAENNQSGGATITFKLPINQLDVTN